MTADDSATSYQWFKNDVAIPGATDAELVIRSTSTGDAGTYHVMVGNACGTVNSADATLTIQTPATIVGQPQSMTGSLGGVVGFLVTVSGPGPITFQWRHNGVDIPGAMSAILVVSGLTADDVGVYTVVVTNPCGSVESAEAILTIPGVGMPGDSDGDGDVDLADFGEFQLCFGSLRLEDCDVFDFDDDGDVDLVDFAEFQLAFTGSM